MSEKIAFIPARGGSKRFVRKNIAEFNGAPMLGLSIACAINAKVFDRIIVSTEDEEIAEVAREYGAEVDNRPIELSGDLVSVDEVCLNFLNRTGVNHKSLLIVLYPACPLRLSKDIIRVLDFIKKDNCDFAITATYLPFDPHETLVIDKKNEARFWFQEASSIKRQDREKLIIDIGSVYGAKVGKFIEQRTIFGEKMRAVIIPKERAVDIDTEEDLELAKFYFSKLKNKFLEKVS